MADANFQTVTLAVTFWQRLWGLLGRRSFEGMLVLAPCRDIHTFGMRMGIDVAFLDSNGRVVRSERAVGPWRHMSCKKAVCVMERQAAAAMPWPQVGEQLSLKFIEEREVTYRKDGVDHEAVPGVQCDVL